MTTAALDTQEQRLLTELLEAQHAALYGYGVLGARLDAATRPAAQAAANAHRSTRDRLADLLRESGAQAPAPLPAYDVAVSGQPDALELAVRLEEGLSVRWLDLIGGTDAFGLRRLGVDGLTETAVRAASWRRLLGRQPPTVALPGTAETG